ncbi:protein SEMI-ROLLED LEAF 2 isoform X2 [Typha angustifolia]|uniref:protein SEMI-ROLLED LEAF 2 isoform X2 n=1 Tax=Typha angustifolia TaxID=59011 RepID=UPI003C2FC261
MGVMSRRVLPACGSLCIFCPSLRARSRQPVKRYKKLLGDIFPRSQDREPDDRMISKLCEYAKKNPTRIPKITEYLEQRCYKELRNEHFFLARVVPYIYRKLLSSCKEQMPLLSMSSLCIVRTLLEQTRQDDIRIIGCLLLIDFLNNQGDSTYMFNVEGLIPKLCQLCQEVGEDDRGLSLRSAGLQALASVVKFMGDYSHISMEFDDIVSVTLDNYEAHQLVLENGKKEIYHNQSQTYCMKEVTRMEGHRSSFDETRKNVISVSVRDSFNVTLDSTVDVSRDPAYWARVCLYNMTKIAQEATTLRRVLEPLFRYFDSRNFWSPYDGIASSILSEMQALMENSGQNSHLLLSTTIKHLDHKNITKQPIMQINIVKVATQLARQTKPQASVSITNAISDLIRHLRKCMQCSVDASKIGADSSKRNSALHSALEELLVQLTEKVGDVGPILEKMAVALENLPATAIAARTTISSIYRTAQIVASIPNLSYHKKDFPEALFYQLLSAMAHPDHRTRVGSHRVLSAILVPSFSFPWSVKNLPIVLKDYDPQGTLLVALSAFSSSWTINEKMEQNSCNYKEPLRINKSDAEMESMKENGCQHIDEDIQCCTICPPCKRHHNAELSASCPVYEGTNILKLEDEDLRYMRLSRHQVGLLLSSIWTQASSGDNTPANYEAMAHTYSLALLFSRTKNSSHLVLVRCFQLAFSIRRLSLDHENFLQPSRKRSLHTLALAMLISSAKAGDLPDIIPDVKAMMTEKMVNHHLHLIEDSRLCATYVEPSGNILVYGSEEDEIAATNFLATIKKDDKQLKETVISRLLEKFEKTPEKLIGIKEQLLQEFTPDDTFLLGAPLFMETPHPCLPYMQKESDYLDEDSVPALAEDEDPDLDASGNQSDRRTSESINALDVLSVNQLIESIRETARQVTDLPASINPVPYDQMKSQCEALVVGKQQKMSVLLSFKHQQESSKGSTEENLSVSVDPNETLHHPEAESTSIEKEHIRRCDSLSSESEQSFRLPPSSPYDKFLKAAGW